MMYQYYASSRMVAAMIVVVTVLIIIIFTVVLRAKRIPYPLKCVNPRAIVDDTARSATCQIVPFTASANYTWDTFRDHVRLFTTENFYSMPNNCIHVPTGKKLVLRMEPGVRVRVDLQRLGRFALVNGELAVKGSNTDTEFTVANGVGMRDSDSDDTNAGAVRIRQGVMITHGTTFTMEGCSAAFAAGLYIWGGRIDLVDNSSGHPGVMRAIRCFSTRTAGGGFSFYEGVLNLISDHAVIYCEGCSSPHHSGGTIVFGCVVNMIGEQAKFHSVRCSAGSENDDNGYGGGFTTHVMTGNKRGAIHFISEGSHVLVEDCTAASAAGAMIQSCNLYLTGTTTRFIARNCQVVKYRSPDKMMCGCSVYFNAVTAYLPGSSTSPYQNIYVEVTGHTCAAGVSNCKPARVCTYSTNVYVNGTKLSDTCQ
jgi:hypothetical protein